MSFQGETALHRLRASMIGARARQLLDASRAGTVCAVFEHSLYVRSTTGEFVCIGSESVGAGPLNLLVCARDWLLLRLVTPGTVVRAAHDDLAIGAHRIVLAAARLWRPAQLPALRGVTIAQVNDLIRIARATAPQSGLSRLAWDSPSREDDDRWLCFARLGWDALERWLAHGIAEEHWPGVPDAPAAALIGLGPGLTPSGDDVFCGVLVALNALGLDAALEALWSWLAPRLDAHTSALSAAHLRAAAAGEGHAALHELLECLGGDASAMGNALCKISAVGHCSGWDAAAGVVAVLRAYADHMETSRAASSAACAFDGATMTPALSKVRRCAE